jgi:hypothetical protein
VINRLPQLPLPPEHGRGHFDPAQRTEMLTKHLNLTSDQQSKVLDIFKSEQSQIEAPQTDTSVLPEDRHAKIMEIRKASNDQIRGLLDASQRACRTEGRRREEVRTYLYWK